MHHEIQPGYWWASGLLGLLVAAAANTNLYLALLVFDVLDHPKNPAIELLERVVAFLVPALNGKLLYMVGILTLTWYSFSTQDLAKPDY